MARSEGEPGLRERAGHYLLAGGIVGGAIGLLFSGEIVLLGVLAAAGGYALKKSGEKARVGG